MKSTKLIAKVGKYLKSNVLYVIMGGSGRMREKISRGSTDNLISTSLSTAVSPTVLIVGNDTQITWYIDL